MNKVLNFLTILFILGCEGHVQINGLVLDKKTKKPIESAHIVLLNYDILGIPYNIDSIVQKRGLVYYTDSLGKFYLKSGFVGYQIKQKRFNLKIEKHGYTSSQGRYRDTAVIYLTNEK